MPFWGAAVVFVLAVAGFVIGALRLRQCMIVCGLLAAVSAAYMALIIILVSSVR